MMNHLSYRRAARFAAIFLACTAIQAVPADELRSWQDTALAAKTSYQDTHPSLTDRLQAMGARAEFAPPLEGNSAERLLGAERTRLERAFDAQWRERVAESWRQVHEKHQRHIERAAHSEVSSGPIQVQHH